METVRKLRQLVIKNINEIVPRPQRWLWPNRIPIGAVSILVGDPDRGKSYFTVDLACRIKEGLDLPDTGQPSDIKGTSLFLICEDDAETLCQRRNDMGFKDIEFLTCEEAIGDIGIGLLRLDEEVAVLEKTLEDENHDIRVIVIDPMMSFLGAIDGYNDFQVRSQILGPLGRVASKYDVAILLVTHMNKKNDVKSLHRVGGSIGFVAAARAVWEFREHRDGQHPCSSIMVPLKFNRGIAADPLGIGIDEGGKLCYYEVDEETKERVLKGWSPAKKKKATPKLDKAKAAWEETLASGPRKSHGLVAELCERHKISISLFDLARKELGIRLVRIDGIRHYALPTTQARPTDGGEEISK